jgi:5-methylthioadenosine/S-adenosylhomocysteine deaminase
LVVPNRQLLIANAQLPRRVGPNPVRVDVLIDRGVVAATHEVGGGPQLAIGQDVRRIDASDLVVVPGMVNAHVHSNEAFERGLYPSLPLERWLARTYPPLGAPPIPARWHYLRAMLVACDAIRSGTVAVQDDFLNPACDHEALDQVVQAWSDSGLRASVATTLGDRAYLDGMPYARSFCDPELEQALAARPSVPLEAQSEFFVTAHRRWNGAASGRLRVMLGPRGPQRCSNGLLREVSRLSAEYDCAAHMHVLETRTQLAASRQQPGGGFFRRLAAAGLLNERLTINHAVWIDDVDIRAIADSGACVTHNPLSNQRLGSGTSPVRRLLEAGIPVALGSDGPATGDTGCMSAVLRAATLLHRDPGCDAERWIGPDRAWDMATRFGAQSMGLPDRWGTLEAGAPADLVLLNARHRSLIPHHDTIAQFALSAGPDLVDSVIVQGEILMQGGRITAFDETRLLDEAREAGERWQAEVQPALDQSGQRWDPLLRQVLERIRTDTLNETN